MPPSVPPSFPYLSMQQQILVVEIDAARREQQNQKAQALNNHAAKCIEAGKIDKAISVLKFTLHFLRDNEDGRYEEICRCRNCTTDGCIAHSNDLVRLAAMDQTDAGNIVAVAAEQLCTIASSSSNKIHLSPHKSTGAETTEESCRQDKDDCDCNCDCDCDCNFMQARPIRVRCKGHSMGETLHAIVMFNTALAHHLKAMKLSKDNDYNRRRQHTKPGQKQTHRALLLKRELKRTLALYNIAYRMMMQLQQKENGVAQQQAPSNIYFAMILFFNIGHIHQLLNNATKHRQCLEKIESIKMLVAKSCNNNNDNNNDNNNNNDAGEKDHDNHCSERQQQGEPTQP